MLDVRLPYCDWNSNRGSSYDYFSFLVYQVYTHKLREDCQHVVLTKFEYSINDGQIFYAVVNFFNAMNTEN